MLSSTSLSLSPLLPSLALITSPHTQQGQPPSMSDEQDKNGCKIAHNSYTIRTITSYKLAVLLSMFTPPCPVCLHLLTPTRDERWMGQIIDNEPGSEVSSHHNQIQQSEKFAQMLNKEENTVTLYIFTRSLRMWCSIGTSSPRSVQR